MDSETSVAIVRAFNRFYTGIIGLLGEGMHKSPYSLAEARLVHEIGKRGRTKASELSADLGLDRGQLSRLVWRLSDHGLLALTSDNADRRSNTLALTPDGEAVFRQLNTASDDAAAALLSPLDPFRRLDLLAAMRHIQTLLSPQHPAAPTVLRPHRVGELGWLIHRQGLLYHLEQGWNGEFEALIASLYAEFEAMPATAKKALWIAEREGQIAGSVYIVPAHGKTNTAQLRMLYVEPAFRGLGIGRRLVAEAVDFSRRAGYGEVILWTQDCLTSARRIYQAAGFTLAEEERHHAFGHDLNGQYWRLPLTAQ